MKQHKTIWIILLLAALLLGASVLYTQLAPSSGALAPTSAPESDSATPEPIAAPDFTAYDLDGNAVQLSDFAGSPIVLNFWASWCGPCRMLSPVVDEVAEERTDVKVGKVNVDEQPELAGEFGVMSIPTLLLFENGKLVRQAVGARPKSGVLELLG